MVSLCVYNDGDWLQLGTGSSNRYDSINTLVMRYATVALPIPQLVIMWYSRISDTHYTHHSIISLEQDLQEITFQLN